MAPDEPDPHINGIPTREYVDALFAEKERALEVASTERGRTADAVRQALSDQIDAGDKLLERHVEDQIAAIRAALVAAERLREEGHERIEQAAQAAQRAIDKAEESIQRRLDLLDAFRESQADEASKFALREVVEAQVKDLRQRLDVVTDAALTYVTREMLEQRITSMEERLSRVEFGPPQGGG